VTKHFKFDWFSPNIPSFEAHLAPLRGTPCRLLEIGSHEGRSTTWLIEHVANHPESRIDCVDPYLQDNFWSNLAAVGGVEQISFHQSTSRDALRILPQNSFDFVYIDGSHWTADVLEDAVLSFPLCKLGGLIAFDDYLWDDPQWNQHGCPKPAIDFFLQAYAEKLQLLEKNHQVWIKRISD
jgi:predicted O-methyltransferase YrrM